MIYFTITFVSSFSNRALMNQVHADNEKIEVQLVQKTILLHSLGSGFGNLTATIENIPPGVIEIEDEAAEFIEKATSNCCWKLFGLCCCCSCCISTCSKMNHQCAIALTQCLSALGCLGCFVCCQYCCCDGNK